ncbi:MAG: YitT family protein [Lachnospiraceae bacterium]|nr:YitT family protein [Lachnospiraceae bacterium]
MDNKTKKIIYSLFFVGIGNFLYALTVKLFLLPPSLVIGGTTGIALTISNFVAIPISGFVFIFNMAMLLVGLIILGKQFALTTVASSVLYPLFLELFNQLLGDYVISNDILLCTIFSGLGIGLSLGMVIRSGASTGGMDIPPLVLNKKLHIPVSVSLYVFDIIIILSQAFFRPVENILYGILLTLIYSMVLNKVMIIGSNKMQIKVISKKSEEIRLAIISQIDRGVTILDGTGGYTGNDTPVILSIVSNREIHKVEKLVHTIDPECFMIISSVNEVRGKGFSLAKKYNQ